MKKPLIIMASVGGVAVLAVAIIGYLAFAASSEQEETRESIDSALSNVQRINNRPIAPIMDSVSAIEENTAALEKWYGEALQLVSVGDCALDASLTPSSFKEKLVEEAAALSKEPGNVLGSIVKEGYAFGFDRFITGSDLPEAEKIAEYNRQWEDIKVLVKALSKSGGSEFVSIEVKSVPEILKAIGVNVEDEKAAAKKDDKKGGRANPRANNKKKAEAEKPLESYSMQGYHIVYRARPQAQVKFLNELASCPRFVTTFYLTFAHEDDPIARVLAPEKKTENVSSKKRGRGKKRAETDEAASEEAAADVKAPSGIVIDTDNAGELVVTLDLATIDFKTKEAKSNEEQN